MLYVVSCHFFFFNQKTAYDMRISDWSSDVCSSDLFPYLARVTDLNVALASELADAPAAPATASIEGAVSSNTTVRWAPVKDAAGYRIRWRRADRTDWTESRDGPADSAQLAHPGVVIADHFFGVSALSSR